MVDEPNRERRRIEIEGAVQGVGFRPFVYRLARELDLNGWVANDSRGVVIEVEGDPRSLAQFPDRLHAGLPPAAAIEHWIANSKAPVGASGFEIRASPRDGPRTAQMLPDLATCDACVAELFDPGDRRFRYPFTNCTHCGPRLSIILALPYDRARTTMAGFEMCRDCRAEYEDPGNRRFHAQPNACPACGPRLTLCDRAGSASAVAGDALAATVAAIRNGEIVAIQGLGGFHLVLDARNGGAIERLREGKPRREKPLALMLRNTEQAKSLCHVDAAAHALLRSPEAPIVLLPRRHDANLDERIAPGNPTLGVMLPATPLHHLLLHDLDFPVVATSGNLSDEPVCIDGREAIERPGPSRRPFPDPRPADRTPGR